MTSPTQEQREAARNDMACQICWYSAWVSVPPDYVMEYEETVINTEKLGRARCDYCWLSGATAERESRLRGLLERAGASLRGFGDDGGLLAEIHEELKR